MEGGEEGGKGRRREGKGDGGGGHLAAAPAAPRGASRSPVAGRGEQGGPTELSCPARRCRQLRIHIYMCTSTCITYRWMYI